MSVQQFVCAVLSTAVLGLPAYSMAEYILQFHNGREVVTSQYWREDNALLFLLDGGVAKVAEHTIRDIKAVQTFPPVVSTPTAEQRGSLRGEGSSPSLPTRTVAGQAESPEYSDQKRLLQTQLHTLLERYGQASQTQNAAAMLQIQEEITAWSVQVFDLGAGRRCPPDSATLSPAAGVR